MPTWLLYIIAAFATYRTARMIAEEDGPAFVFKRLRDRWTDTSSSIALGVRCFYCVSFWVALPVARVVVVVDPRFDVWLWPVFWLGIAGLAAKLYEFWSRK